MSWAELGRLLRVVFLLRVPLFTLLFLAVLGPVALGPLSGLLANLFDQEGSATNFILVTLVAFLLASTAVTAINLVLIYGCERISDPDLALSQRHPLRTYVLAMLCAVSIVVCMAIQTRQACALSALYSLIGFVIAMLFVFAAKSFQLWLSDREVTPFPPPYLVFPAYRIGPLRKLLDSLYCQNPRSLHGVKDFLNRRSQWLLETLQPAGQGYFEAPLSRRPLRLRSGHMFALALSVLSFLIYLGIGFWQQVRIGSAQSPVHALAYVLLFVIVACWALSALTFFFDRYRFPLLWTIGALSLLTTFAPESDHYYRVVHLHQPLGSFPAPGEVFRGHFDQSHGRVILVATAGGGIQASAWTGQVLQGLRELGQSEHVDFPASVALISAVSGGSTGALSFLRSYPGAVEGESQDQFATVARRAWQPALDEVAWGLVNPDFWRTVVPWFRQKTVDRGWAIERKWAKVQGLKDSADGVHDSLISKWAPLARSAMPGVVFNSMIVETGQPVVFSNTAFPKSGNARGIRSFYDIETRNVDVRVQTAVRLSASFPYVAPAARSDNEAPVFPDYHLVDGGYYDNYGMNSLLGWLEDALESGAPEAREVLVLQIRSFGPAGVAAKQEHGWHFQIVAPIVGLTNMRDAAQDSNDRSALNYFARAYASRPDHPVKVWTTRFTYSTDPDNQKKCQSPPLSWKLSQAQIECVGEAWNTVKLVELSKAKSCVTAFLKGEGVPGFCDDASQ